jgi:hypothetical protein
VVFYPAGVSPNLVIQLRPRHPGTRYDPLGDTLVEVGAEPHNAESGHIGLRSCPFHRLAVTAPQLVCGFHLQT